MLDHLILIQLVDDNCPIKITVFVYEQNGIFVVYNIWHVLIQVSALKTLESIPSNTKLLFFIFGCPYPIHIKINCNHQEVPNTLANNRSRSFTLSGNSNFGVNAMVGSGTQNIPNSCPNDYIMIGCARVADRQPFTNQCEDRICGGTFNAEISSTERTVSSMYLKRFN